MTNPTQPSEPTAEERARRVWEHADDDDAFQNQMVHQIRAAVEAETSRCARIAETAHKDVINAGGALIAAAIRAKPETQKENNDGS